MKEFTRYPMVALEDYSTGEGLTPLMSTLECCILPPLKQTEGA